MVSGGSSVSHLIFTFTKIHLHFATLCAFLYCKYHNTYANKHFNIFISLNKCFSLSATKS